MIGWGAWRVKSHAGFMSGTTVESASFGGQSQNALKEGENEKKGTIGQRQAFQVT